MNLLIPRIEWADQIMSADLDDTTTLITGIADTTTLAVGMGVRGADIPLGATIASIVDGVSFNLSVEPSATVLGEDLTFFKIYEFTYPPTDDDEGQSNGNVVDSKSLTGDRQRQFNYLESIRKLQFGFIPDDDRSNILRGDFYQTWAMFGNQFRYLDDKTNLASFDVWEMNKASFPDSRQIKKFPTFLYQIMFEFRKVVL